MRTTVTYLFDPLSEPQRELEALKALQEARHLHGLDTCDLSVVETLLRDLGLAAADRLAGSDAELLAANTARIQEAQGLMQTFGAQGVPARSKGTKDGSPEEEPAGLDTN